MSTFFSTAVASKTAAPKAPSRRRGAAAPAKAPASLSAPAPTQGGGESTQPPTPIRSEQVAESNLSTQERENAPSASETQQPAPQATVLPVTPAVEPVPIVDSSASTQPAQEPTPAPTAEVAPTSTIQQPSAVTTQPLIWREPVTVEQQRSASTNTTTNGTAAANKKRPAETLDAQSAQAPAKRTKKSSTRTNAISQAIANDEPLPSTRTRRGSPVAFSATATQSTPRVTRARTRAQAADASDVETDSSTRKQKRMPKSVAVIRNSDDESELPDGTDAVGPKQKRRRSKKTTKKKKRPGEDGEDDEEAESESELREIDPNTMSMYALSRAGKIGKKSEREKKMAEIDWSEVARKRREEANRIASGEVQTETAKVVETTESPDGTAAPTPGGNEQNEAVPAPETEAGPPADGVRFRIVNGQIVEDEDTLRIDRQAQAEASAQDTAAAEEENDLTVRHNRATWVNQRRREPTERVPSWKARSDPWTEDETDQFYDALASFGTDFYSISKMFIGKTRHQVKTKFTREERLDPGRINDALLGKQTTRKMSLQEYAQACGREVTAFTKYESLAAAESTIAGELHEKRIVLEEAEARRREDERQENIQREQKKAEAAALKKQNARRGRKGKQQGGGTLGGGQAEAGAVEA